MMFSSEREALRFLAKKVVSQAAYEGAPLTDVEQRLLMFNETDPECPRIPDDVLSNEDLEYEAKVTRVLRAAYLRDRETNPEESSRYHVAMEGLKESDAYLPVMAEQALKQATKGRDLLKFAVIVLLVTIAVFAFAFWRAQR